MDKNTQPNNNGNHKFGKRWVLWLFVALLCALLLNSLASNLIHNLFIGLLSGIAPVLIALAVAFILLKPTALIENKLLKNCFVGNQNAHKYKRIIALTIEFLIIIGILVLFFVIAVPNLINMFEQFQGDNLNTLVTKLKNGLTSIMQSITGLPAEQLDEAITNAINNIGAYVQQVITDISKNITQVLSDTLSAILSTVIGLLLAFLLIKDKELIAKTGRRMTYAYNEHQKAEEIITLTHKTNDMFNQYIISNLIVMSIVFVIAWAGFAIMGVPMAILMALFLGIFTIIPYLGGFIACVPLAIVTLMFGDVNLMLMAIIFAIADWAIVTTFVPMFVMSKRMHIRAVVLLLGLTIGGAMFGVLGMILSAPVVSVISIIWRERIAIREARKEHEEMVEAGILDTDYNELSDILDLTQDTAYNMPAEVIEDDFTRLQALKQNGDQVSKDEGLKVVRTKTTQKEHITKRELTKLSKNEVVKEPKIENQENKDIKEEI